MTTADDQLLSQFLDGELRPEDTALLSRRLESEPALRTRLEQLQRVDQALQQAFFHSPDQLPDNILTLLQDSDEQADSRVVPLRPLAQPRWAMALAASLVAAVGLVAVQPWQVAERGEDGMPALANSPELSRVLEREASRAEGWVALDEDTRVRPVLSFANTSGGWCREYLMAQEDHTWRGVACRGDSHWNTQILVTTQVTPSQTEGYQTASADPLELLESYIDENSGGIPLSWKQESELISSAWQ